MRLKATNIYLTLYFFLFCMQIATCKRTGNYSNSGRKRIIKNDELQPMPTASSDKYVTVQTKNNWANREPVFDSQKKRVYNKDDNEELKRSYGKEDSEDVKQTFDKKVVEKKQEHSFTENKWNPSLEGQRDEGKWPKDEDKWQKVEDKWQKDDDKWQKNTDKRHYDEERRHPDSPPEYVIKKGKYMRQTQQRPIPTPLPRPEHGSKYLVDWFGDIHNFALSMSSDMQYRIRQSPLPEMGSPWPMPQIYRPNDIVFRLSDDFRMLSIGETCDVLEFYLKRVHSNVFGNGMEGKKDESSPPEWHNAHRSTTLYTVYHLNVTVLKECEHYPSFEMDESYDLEIKRTGASIIAREVWGALRGLETFSQLVYQNHEGWYLVNKTFIHDFPRFKHRGILLDTARHYLRKEVLIQNLEAMAINKMNVFHWHIVDDQSFPYQSQVFPNLSRFGAYNPKTHIYTHSDIKEVIEQARLRGIRVIPEFDTPGHTYSWGLGQNYLLTPCYDYRHRPTGAFGPINPILKSTYRFLETLFTEILGLFPDKFMHVGGDEVSHDCWLMNPHISSFMHRNNLSDVRDLLALYNRKILEMVTDIGKQRNQGGSSIVWQEVFDTGTKMPKDTIVQVWMGDALDVERVMRAGQRVIFSSCWYLDYINYGMDWDKYYLCEQLTQQMEQYGIRNLSMLVGGEACLWTEFADNDDIMARLWPRASATAERLWSSEYHINIVEAAPRIEALRCRMLRLGLSVGVLNGPGWCEGVRSNMKQSSGDGSSNLFLWKNEIPMLAESTDQSRKIYIVNLNAMYVIPLILLVCVVAVIVFLTVQENNGNGRSGHCRIVSSVLLPLPRNIRSLILVFFLFAVCWCIWTSPIWMNVWESKRV